MASIEQTIALAGIFQAATLVQSIAYRGMFELTDLETCIKSLMATDAPDTLSVYGERIQVLKLGLNSLINNFNGQTKDPRAVELARYIINILVLEKKLSQNPDLLDKLAEGIERARQQTEHFPIAHENITSALANLYKQTISNLGPKIMVNGEHDHLNNKNHAARIRTLLLAAVRSAVLWRQKGGVRWKLIFERNKIKNLAEKLLKEGYPV